MPIVIYKASDEAILIEERRKKKYDELLRAKLKKKGDNEVDRDKIRKLLYSSSSEDELNEKHKPVPHNNTAPTRPEGSATRRSRRVAYISSNDELKDLLSLKLFHRPHASITQIIKHNKVEDIKTKLVGEDLFYTEEERDECFKELRADSLLSTHKAEKKSASTVDAAGNGPDDGVHSTRVKTDVLQKLLIIKDNLCKLSKQNKTDFYSRTKESNTRTNFIKVGQCLFDRLDDERRTFDDSMRWALDQATNNLESLYNYVINTDTEVKEYEHEKNMTPSQRAKYSIGKKNIADTDNRKSMFNKKAQTKSNSLHVHNAAQSISQQLDKYANENKSTFLASVLANGSHRGVSASNTHGRLSLRTATKFVITAQPPSNPRGSLRAARPNGSAIIDVEQSNISISPVSESEVLTNTIESGNIKNNTMTVVSNDVDTVNFTNKDVRVMKDANVVISVENECGETDLMVKVPPKGTILTSAVMPTPEVNSPQKSPRKPPVARQALSKKASKQKEKYTNMMEDNTQAAIKAARKLQAFFRKQLKGTLDQFAHVQKHITVLTAKNDALTTACEVNSERVAFRVEKFQRRQRDHDSRVSSLCTNANFNWPFSTQAKLECFQIDAAHVDKTLNQSVVKNMELMRKDAEYKMKCDKLDNLLNAKWFVAFTTKLKEYLHRSSAICPKNCFIFLSVLKDLIGLGFTMNAKLLYRVIESTLIDKDDHKAVIVHKAVKALREVVNVGAEAFMKYLESKDVTPCPELLAQIRTNKRKRDRKEKLAQQRKAKLSALNKHLGSSSSGIGLSIAEGNLGSKVQLHKNKSKSDVSSMSRQGSRVSMSRQGSRVSIIGDVDGVETDGGDASEMGSIWDGSEFEFEEDDF